MPRRVRSGNADAAPDALQRRLERLRQEQQAVELERLMLADAIARARQAHRASRYAPPPTILANPYLPTVCTAALLALLAFLEYR